MKKIVSILMLTILAGTMFTSCDLLSFLDDDDDEDDTEITDDGIDSALIGTWRGEYIDEGEYGDEKLNGWVKYTFQYDHVFIWEDWELGTLRGTWSADGQKLRINLPDLDEDDYTYTYRVDGKQLYLYVPDFDEERQKWIYETIVMVKQ